ncbi:hypothetical protein LX32DRAFT_715981 [Colletotrichum zoysiae]|uniref:Uncharacterized protein n=1 Tax=Colletotrichum zoysiae TaxID=1216348 RepID=A0AAD9HTC7_9PEZI|nr:hypothetical protein LX32DRAFT_715981 [Colletotrichum zoysiae]
MNLVAAQNYPLSSSLECDDRIARLGSERVVDKVDPLLGRVPPTAPSEFSSTETLRPGMPFEASEKRLTVEIRYSLAEVVLDPQIDPAVASSVARVLILSGFIHLVPGFHKGSKPRPKVEVAASSISLISTPSYGALRASRRYSTMKKGKLEKFKHYHRRLIGSIF